MKIIWNIFIGLSVLLVLALMVRGYSASQPDMPLSDIVFSHNIHEDLVCADCHINLERSETAQENILPVMDVCGECHDIETDDECGMCHRNPEERVLIRK